MNETAKRVGVIVLAVAALGVAVFEGYKLFSPPALEQGVVHPSPAKSMAQMEKEKMQQEDAAAKGQAAATTGTDPGASLSGKR